MNKNEYDLLFSYEQKNWWFIAKMDRLAHLLHKRNYENISLLDVGCGVGTEALILKKYGRVIATDNAFAALKYCKERGINGVCATAEKLPFKKEQFDVVFAIDVIEHIKDDRSALEEWHRLCKRSGTLWITTSAFPSLFNEHDIAVHHFRRYGKKELRKKLEDAGYEVLWMNYGYVCLFIPLFFVVLFNKISPYKIKIKTESLEVHPILNFCLLYIMKLENVLVKRIPFPFGTALLCEARKK